MPPSRQDAALLVAQVSVVDWPDVMEAGLAAKEEMTGAAGAVTVTVAEAVALPPGPVQVSV